MYRGLTVGVPVAALQASLADGVLQPRNCEYRKRSAGQVPIQACKATVRLAPDSAEALLQYTYEELTQRVIRMRISRDSNTIVNTNDIVAAFIDAWGSPLPKRDTSVETPITHEVGRWQRGPVEARVYWMFLSEGRGTHVGIQIEQDDDFADRIRPWRP
jgi:hypothetical protein